MRHRATAVLSASVLIAGTLAAAVPAAATPSPATPPTGHPVHSRPAHPSVLHGRALSVRPGATAQVTAPTGKVDPAVRHQHTFHGGQVRVSVSGNATAVDRAVRAVGGHVVVAQGGTSSVVLPASKVTDLAASPAVAAIAEPEHPVTASTTYSEGVHASGADAWQSPGGITGTGVKVAVVDAGFGADVTEYNNEVTAGHLGTSPTVVDVNSGCANSPGGSAYADPHGLATAEIVHQQAPGAQLFLYCVYDSADMSAIVTDIESNGIKIVSSSLAWPGDARGDGSGPDTSVTAAVTKARKDGVLWIESAGNTVDQHYGGTTVDRNGDAVLDFGNSDPNTFPFESNFFALSAGNGSPAYADFYFQWDQWPTTSAGAQIIAQGAQCTTDYAPNNGLDGCQAYFLNPISLSHTAGRKPVLNVDTSSEANTGVYEQIWYVQVKVAPSFPRGVRFDLTGYGPFDGNSSDSCTHYNSNGYCDNYPAAATVNSITSPADSPYVMGVGAVDVGADGLGQNLEYFSSRGPTIDNRPKPDISGWDGVSTYVPEEQSGNGFFYGTSAAAPHVAGAAALVAAQNPTWDAAELQNFLEQRASSGAPHNPSANADGHGTLTLGSTTTALPSTAGYTALAAPLRVLDSRSTGGAFGKGTIRQYSLHGRIPADATSVAINLTGTGASGSTFLAVFPGGTAWAHTSNLNLSQSDTTAAVFAVVTLGPNQTIQIRNDQGTVNVLVDVLGTFAPSGGSLLTTVTPNRVLDTRSTGQRLANGGTIQVTPGANPPAGTTAVVVNVTATKSGGAGYLSAAPTCTNTTSTLNYGSYDRANLAIVGLSGAGTFCITNIKSPVDVIVDVVGYLSASGSAYVALPAPTRILDSRTGNGNTGNVAPTPFGPATQRSDTARGIYDVPSTATTLLLGVVEASATYRGFLNVYPEGATPDANSTLNFTAGRIVPNAVLVGAGSGGATGPFGVYNSAGLTQVAVDLFGYFV